MCQSCCGSPLKVTIWISIGVISIILIAVFGSSFQIVDVKDYGLMFNLNTQYLSPKVYQSGRYLVGPQYRFITFKRTYYLMQFSDKDDASYSKLDCWSKNGQNVYLDLNFYFVIEKNNLYNFFMEYGKDWHGIFLQLAIATIKDKANQYEATKFFQSRQTIKTALFSAIKAAFKQKSGGTLNVTQFQLRRVSTDDEFEKAVELKVVQNQEKQKLENIRSLLQIQKDIVKIQEDANNQIRTFTADKRKEANDIIAESQAKAQKTNFQDEATEYKTFGATLQLDKNSGGIPNPTDLLNFIYIDALRNLSTNRTEVIFGLDPTASIS